MMAVLTLLAVGICMPALAAIFVAAAILIPAQRRENDTLKSENQARARENAELRAAFASLRSDDDLESIKRRLTELELRRNLR